MQGLQINEAIQLYRDILDRKKKRFPSGFWSEGCAKNHKDAAIITRYLFEDILEWDDEQILLYASYQTFVQYKLRGMLSALFNDSYYEAIANAYPGRFSRDQFFTRNFWNKTEAIKATRRLLKDKLKLSDNEIRHFNSRKVFVQNGLSAMLHLIYKNNASQAVKEAFPELF